MPTYERMPGAEALRAASSAEDEIASAQAKAGRAKSKHCRHTEADAEAYERQKRVETDRQVADKQILENRIQRQVRLLLLPTKTSGRIGRGRIARSLLRIF